MAGVVEAALLWSDRSLSVGALELELEGEHVQMHDLFVYEQTGVGPDGNAVVLRFAGQVAALRPRLRDSVRTDGVPQLLLRLGYPDGSVPPSSRRSLGEVLLGTPA